MYDLCVCNAYVAAIPNQNVQQTFHYLRQKIVKMARFKWGIFRKIGSF